MATKKSRAALKLSTKKNVHAPKKKDTTLPIFTHILGILTGFVGALIILLVADDEYAKKHARRALNWQLSLLIYYIISAILIIVLIGFVLIGILAILNIIFCIIAAVRASNNNLYDYPLTISFLND